MALLVPGSCSPENRQWPGLPSQITGLYTHIKIVSKPGTEKINEDLIWLVPITLYTCRQSDLCVMSPELPEGS